jgi:hypothetical protein
MDRQRVTVFAIVVLLSLGWFFRYDFQVVATGGQGSAAVAYMLNRWTGTVYLATPTLIRELPPERPANAFDQK